VEKKSKMKKKGNTDEMTGFDGIDLDAVLAALKGMGGIPDKPSEEYTKLEDAEFAREDGDMAQAQKLAKEVHDKEPDNIKAYIILAQSSKTIDGSIDWYQKGVKAFEKSVGPQYMEENKGNFWMIFETRDYMRCLQGYGECLFQAGLVSDAIEVYEKILELCPGDNMGVRYSYVPWLIIAGDTKKAREYLDTKEYIDAMFLFDILLLDILEKKPLRILKASFKKACKENKFIVPFILKEKRMARTLPDSYSPGSKEEALLYMRSEWGEIMWKEYPQAITKLSELNKAEMAKKN
jgi:tetratricopeptide (TPR) repeat protein